MERHFRFEKQDFKEVFAHGGARPILTRRVLDAAGGSACNFLDLTIVPPGGGIGLHTHRADNEEIYIVVTGCGEMEVDGRRFPVAPGDVIVNRPGGTHGLWNTGTASMKLVVIEVAVLPLAGG